MTNQRLKTNEPIIWEGDLDDDCTAIWGLMLRAEEMDDNIWWWRVSDMENDEEVDCSNEYAIRFTSGREARQAAEQVARMYLGV